MIPSRSAAEFFKVVDFLTKPEALQEIRDAFDQLNMKEDELEKREEEVVVREAQAKALYNRADTIVQAENVRKAELDRRERELDKRDTDLQSLTSKIELDKSGVVTDRAAFDAWQRDKQQEFEERQVRLNAREKDLVDREVDYGLRLQEVEKREKRIRDAFGEG